MSSMRLEHKKAIDTPRIRLYCDKTSPLVTGNDTWTFLLLTRIPKIYTR